MSPDRRGEALDAVLDNATPVLEFAESALDFVPVPGLSLVAKALSVLLDGVKNARANDGTCHAFMDEVKALDDTLMNMLKQTRAAMDDTDKDARTALMDDIAGSEELRLRVQTLRSTIEELGKRTKNLKGGPGAFGFCKGVVYSSRNEATLSDMKDGLASAIRIFKLEGQLSIETVLSSVIQDAKKIRQALKEAEEQKVLDSIPRASAGYRCADELKSEFLDGTREELFNELSLWSTSDFPQDNPKRFYLLSGGAGLGKSSIAHQLCTRLDASSEPVLGASFFFVRGGGELESIRLFFSSLAHQLAQSQPTLRPHIIATARQYLKRGDRQQMKYAFEELLRKPLAGASIVTQTPVLIVVDGLDECKERKLVPDLLQYLLELVRALPWVRVFVTSRPEPHIMSVLTSADAIIVVYHRSLEKTLEEWGGDVRYYLKESVSKIPPYGDFLRNNPRFLERLIHRAGGVFIFARLAVRFLDTYCGFPNPQEQFELLLSSGGEGLSPLDDLYLQILLSAFPLKDFPASSPGHARLRSFLMIIALQKERLTPEAMALLGLGLLKDDIVWMTDRLRSTLLIDNKSCVVPLHATFGEFLLDPHRCINPLYHINPSKGCVQFASACIAALTFENVSGYLPADHDAPLRWCVSYAARNWDSYLENAEFDDELKQQLMCLIRAQMPVYKRIGLGWSSTADRFIIARIEQWLKDSGDPAEISLEYAKSSAYSWLWWRKMYRLPNLRNDAGVGSPNINADDIASRMMEIFDKLRDSSALDLTVKSSDIARCQAMHEELVQTIRGAGLEGVWFNPELD
ncbi:hypothetical protein DFH08DRAFT_946105 [Mycena albidolilacea]|uniref:NACHT domain-containing protein n=1 Tax=Mycena albidolilacea TaxID=1033008 RepID=A0AAD6YYD1_9AGAR|nr:hypothetical protein DFH08DRAFT_946105 [Mycena albidolilacea]